MDDTALAGWVARNLAYLAGTCTDMPWADASERTEAMDPRLTRDEELAEQAEEALTKLMLDAQELPGVPCVNEDEDLLNAEINVIETFAEQGMFTSDKGLVLFLSDGRQLHLTITAYGPAKS